MPATVPDPRINIGTRLASMGMDHVFMCVVAIAFALPMFMRGMINAFDMSASMDETPFYQGPLFYLALAGFALYICKDCINGRSLAKRVLGHQVVRNTTGEAASPLRCLVRNFFIVLWPVEVVVVMVNPSRRLGDMVAGTRVASYDKTAVQPGIRPLQASASLLIILGLMFLIVSPLESRKRNRSAGFKTSSYNAQESRALEKLYADSMGSLLTASVHVYDTAAKPGVKYITVMCNLHDNYLEDDASSDFLRENVKKYAYSLFPANTFTGKIKLLYRRGGTMKANVCYMGSAW